MFPDPANPMHLLVLKEKCPLCRAQVGDECTNPIRPGEPLPGRRFHHARTEVFDMRLRRYTSQEGLPCDG